MQFSFKRMDIFSLDDEVHFLSWLHTSFVLSIQNIDLNDVLFLSSFQFLFTVSAAVARARVYVCVWVCVRACVRACVCVGAPALVEVCFDCILFFVVIGYVLYFWETAHKRVHNHHYY